MTTITITCPVCKKEHTYHFSDDDGIVLTAQFFSFEIINPFKLFFPGLRMLTKIAKGKSQRVTRVFPCQTKGVEFEVVFEKK